MARTVLRPGGGRWTSWRVYMRLHDLGYQTLAAVSAGGLVIGQAVVVPPERRHLSPTHTEPFRLSPRLFVHVSARLALFCLFRRCSWIIAAPEW